MLLLFRLHALWGGRRSVVLSTLALYLLTYAAITVVATFSILELTREWMIEIAVLLANGDYLPLQLIYTTQLSQEYAPLIIDRGLCLRCGRLRWVPQRLFIRRGNINPKAWALVAVL